VLTVDNMVEWLSVFMLVFSDSADSGWYGRVVVCVYACIQPLCWQWLSVFMLVFSDSADMVEWLSVFMLVFSHSADSGWYGRVVVCVYACIQPLCWQWMIWSSGCLCLCLYSATLLLKTDKSEAALVYRQLIDRNPENSLYFYGLEKATEACEYIVPFGEVSGLSSFKNF